MDEARQKARIDSTAFSKYFYLKVPYKELSDHNIREIFRLWKDSKHKEDDIGKVIIELRWRNHLIGFLEKIYRIYLSEVSEELAPHLIRYIYKNIETFSKKGTENFWQSEFDKAEFLTLYLLNDKIIDKRRQSLSEEIVKKTNSFYFAATFILLTNKNRGTEFHELRNSLDRLRLMKILTERLKSYYVDSKRNIFEDIKDRDWNLVLYQWGTTWGTSNSINKKIVNEYVLNLIESNYKYFIEFISATIRHIRPSGEKEINIKQVSDIYDLFKIKEITKKYHNSNILTAEQRELVKIFLSSLEKFIEQKNKK